MASHGKPWRATCCRIEEIPPNCVTLYTYPRMTCLRLVINLNLYLDYRMSPYSYNKHVTDGLKVVIIKF